MEAILMASVNHPNIVHTLKVGPGQGRGDGSWPGHAVHA